MGPFNLSATVNILRTLKNPALLYPQCTIPTFNDLPAPLSSAFPGRNADIRAVVLDKDNCFAVPHALTVFPAYSATFERLRSEFPGDRLLIVSNSAGTNDDPGGKEAALLEKNTGVTVLRHATKKPGCWDEIMVFLRKHTEVEGPEHVAVVGDRLFTDVLMANMMGSWGVWVKTGVQSPEKRLYGKVEAGVMGLLERRGWAPLVPGLAVKKE